MKASDKVMFGFVLALLVAIVGINYYAQVLFEDSSSAVSLSKRSSQSNLLTGAVVGSNDGSSDGLSLQSSLSPTFQEHNTVECWSLSTQNQCEGNANKGCFWKTMSGGFGGFCKRAECYEGDFTNQTYCETTLKTYNASCTWNAGTSYCNPVAGTGFFGDGCSDFNSNAQACYNSFFCIWNTSDSTCLEPLGQTVGDFGTKNPSCSVLTSQDLCINISGCTWSAVASSCSGNAGGIECTQLNKSICSTFTQLSTCCSWNSSNSCAKSINKGCYDSIPPQPAGGAFCEDYKAFKSQSLCENLSSSPWYMPCKWNNVTNECHFNDDAFGGTSSFQEVGTQLGCESMGGFWKTEQYADSSGALKTDTWCEFKFGLDNFGGGNCDSACWACETSVSVANGNTSSQAQTLCENSGLGYCEYRADSNAYNGLGWCNPKMSFIDGGGKGCDDECSSCDFLKAPQAQCQNSSNGCVWVGDATAPNKEGYCYGKSEKRCANDCWSCYTSNDCVITGKGGEGACAWDGLNYICKPSGFTGEICFNGLDDDADTKLDCVDSDCATDKFCGGEDLEEGFGQECPSFTTISSCTTVGCVWMNDTFEEHKGGIGSAGHCDFPGAQCWEHDSDSALCNATSGCGYITISGGFCHENTTLFDSCFPKNNSGNCLAVAGCGWVNDSYSNFGRCEPVVFSQCFNNETRRSNQTNCEMNETVSSASTQICKWTLNQFSTQSGFCDPVCWSKAGTTAECQTPTKGLCQVQTGLCEPTTFGGACIMADGNRTRCEKGFNSTCVWFTDGLANNNVSNGTPGVGTTPSGWCDPKLEAKMVEFMGTIEPVVIGTDANEEIVEDKFDILGVGLRDEFKQIAFGTRLNDYLANSSICNATPTYNTGARGYGSLNHTFLWYVDSNGNATDACATRHNSSEVGYEFLFKYQGYWSGSFTEVKASYRCINGTWGAAPIPLTSSKDIMCDVVGGGMASVDKAEMFKFKGFYNKSKDLRIYAVVSNSTANDSIAHDFAGPFYYTQGTIDFRFEDCSNSGGDADEDGILASNDPDCQNFLKFGFVPMEVGFQCGDNQDNDGDGSKDCADDGCKYDYACGGMGVPTADANDKTAPKVVWLQVDTYPDSAFIMYDTNEPANGTLLFYNNDTSCKTLNKTIRDPALLDAITPDYKMWHDGAMDNYGDNVDKLITQLKNNTVFYYKTQICDINGNCALSACLNFTTKKVVADCKGCTSTFDFPFIAETGTAKTDPMGNLSFKFLFPDGTASNLAGNAAAGTQLNHTAAKKFDLLIANDNANNASKWSVKLINASVTGKVSTGVQNFTGGGDLQFNGTVNGSFVGLSTTKCQELINTFRPKKLEIGIPGNHTTEFWHCTSGALVNCTNKATNASNPTNGSLGSGYYNATANKSMWVVPADWGC